MAENITTETKSKKLPVYSGVIKDLQGQTIFTVALWINSRKAKIAVDGAHGTES